MDRKEVCALIRENDLGEEVKKRFGDNYTRIPTKKLEELLEDYDLLEDDSWEDEEEVESDNTSAHETQEVDNPYEAACIAFVGILKDSGLIDGILAKLK